MVVDEFGMVEQSNAMALALFRPKESDPPLNFLLPLVDATTTWSACRQSLDMAQDRKATATPTRWCSPAGSEARFTGDLHIARIEYSQDPT